MQNTVIEYSKTLSRLTSFTAIVLLVYLKNNAE